MIAKQEQEIIKNWKGDRKGPLVSICCITYNHEDYISDALDSFLMQETDFAFEICLGEDDSTDKTREICLQYAKKYPNIIKLFLRKREDVIYINNLPTGRFNIMQTLKKCQGEFIAICEGDDYFLDRNKLEKQVNEMNKYPNIKMSFHKAKVINSDKRGISNVMGSHRNDIQIFNQKKVIINDGSFCPTSSLMFRKEVFEDLSKVFWKVTGFDYFIQIVGSVNNVIFLPYVFSAYRVHDSSLSSEFRRSSLTFFKKNLNLVLSSCILPVAKNRISVINKVLLIIVSVGFLIKNTIIYLVKKTLNVK